MKQACWLGAGLSSACMVKACLLLNLARSLMFPADLRWRASAPRRITNRESARRMRLKRQEEWGVIKRQVLHALP